MQGRGRSLWFDFVAGPLHGGVIRKVSLAPQQIRPLANLHLGAALVGRRVAAITVHAGEDLRVALVVICTAVWSAQGSDTWCTVSQVRQKPAP